MSKLDKDWVLDRLRRLTRWAEELEGVADTNGQPYRPMTVLKLGLLAAALDMFSTVAGSDYNCYYVDLLAGAGVTPLKNRDEFVIGSPFLATDIGGDAFKEFHFIEKDKDRANALQTRLEYAAENTDLNVPIDRCHVWCADANEIVGRASREIYRNGIRGTNTFTFVDNAGPDIHWETLRELCTYRGGELYGDLLITFPATGISRRRGRDEIDELNKFFRSTSWEECDSEDEYRSHYENDLATIGKKVTRGVRIDSGQSGKRYYYDVIYGTRKTGGGSPYTKSIGGMKTRIERLDGDDISNVLDFFVHGNQSSLDLFPDDTDKADTNLFDYT